MLYSRCKCGKREGWDSGMPPAPCDVCPECGSARAYSPSTHPEPEPHRFHAEIERGQVIVRCLRCHAEGNLEDATNREEIKEQARKILEALA